MFLAYFQSVEEPMRCYLCGHQFARNEQVVRREVETGQSRYQSYYSLRSMIFSPLSRRTYYRLVSVCGPCADELDARGRSGVSSLAPGAPGARRFGELAGF
jgi:hypothetical protein